MWIVSDESGEKLLGNVDLRAAQIDKQDGIRAGVTVKIGSINQIRRVAARPLTEPRHAIPRPVVIEPTLLVSFLPSISIPLWRLGLTTYRLISRATVGRIFLVGNCLRPFIQFQ